MTALAVRASSETVKTFSISFAETSFDESSYARAVAKFLGTDHHEERLSANLAANLVGEIGSWMDEPFSDPSLVPTYLLVALHAQARDGGAGWRRRRRTLCRLSDVSWTSMGRDLLTTCRAF